MLSFLKKILGQPAAAPDMATLLQQGAVIIDVRTPGEFQSGHIKGSLNYPLDILPKKMAELKKIKQPIIVVCRSGMRSGLAHRQLRNAGLDASNGGAWTQLQQQIQANSR
jgi:rhodanese-related sulfurtransferase